MRLFLSLHFLVWSIIPMFRKSLPMDSIEAIVWGSLGGWGTNKHPILSGDVAYWFYSLFGSNSVYVLSQIFVLLGFIYIYKLANLFLDKQKSILAVILLEGVVYYGFTSVEYNVNVVSLALWPMATYYFYGALKHNNLKNFILFGVLIGLNLLNKYTSVVLFAAMGFYLLKNPSYLKNYKLYIAVLVGLLIITPHLWWLYEHEFFTLQYFSSRAGTPKIYGHVLYPIKFILAQLLAASFMIINYFWKYKKDAIKTKFEDKEFLFFMGVVPLILFALPSVFSGLPLKSMWGSPLLYLSSILLLVFFPAQLNPVRIKRCSYCFMFVMGGVLLLNILTNTGLRNNFEHHNFIADFEQIWKEKTNNKPLKFISGDIWYVSHIALYSSSKPRVVLELNAPNNPWISDVQKQQDGVLIFGTGANKYSFEVKNHLGKTKRYDINYDIVFKSGEKNDQ